MFNILEEQMVQIKAGFWLIWFWKIWLLDMSVILGKEQ